MARQAALTVSQLKRRLNPVYWDDMSDANTPLRRITNGVGYTPARFGPIADVRSLVVHETDGWPSRNKVEGYVRDYGGNGTTVGPQGAVWGDGTTTPFVQFGDMTGHATFVNGWAIGIETGHRDSDGGYTLGQPPNVRRFAWQNLSTAVQDLVGRKYKVLEQVADNPSEVISAWFPLAGYTGPVRNAPAAGAAPRGGMLFNEAQYRSWALLARYLCEAYLIPRNFPLLPHALRGQSITDAATFRRILMVDENVTAIRDLLIANCLVPPANTPNAAPNVATFVAADFTAGHEPAFDANYRLNARPANVTIRGWPFVHNAMKADGVTPNPVRRNVALNQAWLWFFKGYRGIHGHGFSGNIHSHLSDHDCPGPLFDWHRFAREVWDWWWYPFDLDAAQAHTNTPIRDYRAATGTTPLREYYFHQAAANVAGRAAAFGGIQGPTSSPTTYTLDPDSPVYAMANGEIVAARFPVANAGVVDMGFVLMKHEVYHHLDTNSVATVAAQANGAPPPAPQPIGRIDYDYAPTTVYSLTMHLARPAGLTFTDISDANPEWLNRLIIRRKECDLAYPPPANTINATLAAIPGREFSRPPPVGQSRPTLLEAYQLDQLSLGAFLDALDRGDIAFSQSREAYEAAGQMPIQVILGDYMGRGGTIRREANGTLTKGVRIEVFSPTPIVLGGFVMFVSTPAVGWSGFGTEPKPMLWYQSEWARTPDAAATTALQAMGVDPTLVSWWPVVAQAQALDDQMSAMDRLPLNGEVVHYSPATFMAWLNDVTWASEWPKYQVKDASGNPAGRPAAPRSRWG